MKRVRRAVARRSVTLRPSGDGTCRLSIVTATVQGVTAFKQLDRAAASARATGDRRGHGAIMADKAIARLTGQEMAAAVPVELQLLMTDEALLGGAEDTAWLEGHPIPARVARHLALGVDEAPGREEASTHADRAPGATTRSCPGAVVDVTDAQRWIRRLYTDPQTGRLRAADARRRLFTGEVRRFVLLRDQVCRGPGCGAPIRHVDHVRPHAQGGATTEENGVGLCEHLNYVLEMPGWSSRMIPDPSGVPAHLLEITTPTGRTYTSAAPRLRRTRRRESRGPGSADEGGAGEGSPSADPPPMGGGHRG